MKNIVIIIKDVEVPQYNPIINGIKDTFNLLLQNFELNNSAIIGELFENCAGHILEEYIKLQISHITSAELKNHFKTSTNYSYDFKYDNQPVKLITFNSENNYSDNMLSKTQLESALTNDLMFLCLIYSINENTITISDIKFVDGYRIKTSDDKILYASLIESIQEESDVIDENSIVTTAEPVRLMFSSNIQGNVQIVNN